MLSEQMSDQQIEDSKAIAGLNPKQRGAIARLLERVERDVYRSFTESDEEKAWLKGAGRVLSDITAAMKQTVEDAEAVGAEMEADRELQGEASGSAGDLAIG